MSMNKILGIGVVSIIAVGGLWFAFRQSDEMSGNKEQGAKQGTLSVVAAF